MKSEISDDKQNYKFSEKSGKYYQKYRKNKVEKEKVKNNKKNIKI